MIFRLYYNFLKSLEEKKVKQLREQILKEEIVYFQFFDKNIDRYYWVELTLENAYLLEDFKTVWELNRSTRVIKKEHNNVLRYLEEDKISRRATQKGVHEICGYLDFKEFLYHYCSLSTYKIHISNY